MLMLLIQIIGTIATALIAVILLQKDWRTKNETIRKEAVLVTKIIYAISVVSILNLVILYFQSQSDISKLEKDKRQLQVTNANLSFNVSKAPGAPPDDAISYQNDPSAPAMNAQAKNSVAAVNKAEPKKPVRLRKEPQKHALRVNKIKSVALSKPRNIRDEPDQVPLFHFVSTGRRVLTGVLINRQDKPIYNLLVWVTNYDDLLDCRCFAGNTNSATISTLNQLGSYSFKLPKFKRHAQRGRYLVALRFKNKVYYQQAVYAFDGHVHFSQALRVKQYEGSLLVNSTVIRGANYRLNYVNWNRDFPLSLDEQSRKTYIAAN